MAQLQCDGIEIAVNARFFCSTQKTLLLDKVVILLPDRLNVFEHELSVSLSNPASSA
ncbi:hypothetical protein [Pseudomonas caricapapayae]|uniref:hypothetical protein n=1 Tax=Pseudomonas caricapapayae TaxID=46678 RepID=UPI000A412EA4|nr:hypothetical protein [Pseudomonas caricapapayae]